MRHDDDTNVSMLFLVVANVAERSLQLLQEYHDNMVETTNTIKKPWPQFQSKYELGGYVYRTVTLATLQPEKLKH